MKHALQGTEQALETPQIKMGNDHDDNLSTFFYYLENPLKKINVFSHKKDFVPKKLFGML